MVDEKIVQEWINKADEDFDFARINLNALQAAENIRKFIKRKLK